jgi:hypothetical protein
VTLAADLKNAVATMKAKIPIKAMRNEFRKRELLMADFSLRVAGRPRSSRGSLVGDPEDLASQIIYLDKPL